ncbi:hypothetical protein FIBSPDRAFT_989718 [Athelia psychrophila]|uniref:Uncharacterized protein n=1 Tax=Athelia psychrophila TaxID=1759441 RepID=A0A165ZH95_9AGAM|nr:hypothetical protein FIBSPDRAFT_989718 [Fibularhizoctonia sp. CBS 109695]
MTAPAPSMSALTMRPTLLIIPSAMTGTPSFARKLHKRLWRHSDPQSQLARHDGACDDFKGRMVFLIHWTISTWKTELSCDESTETISRPASARICETLAVDRACLWQRRRRAAWFLGFSSRLSVLVEMELRCEAVEVDDKPALVVLRQNSSPKNSRKFPFGENFGPLEDEGLLRCTELCAASGYGDCAGDGQVTEGEGWENIEVGREADKSRLRENFGEGGRIGDGDSANSIKRRGLVELFVASSPTRPPVAAISFLRDWAGMGTMRAMRVVGGSGVEGDGNQSLGKEICSSCGLKTA